MLGEFSLLVDYLFFMFIVFIFELQHLYNIFDFNSNDNKGAKYAKWQDLPIFK